MFCSPFPHNFKTFSISLLVREYIRLNLRRTIWSLHPVYNAMLEVQLKRNPPPAITNLIWNQVGQMSRRNAVFSYIFLLSFGNSSWEKPKKLICPVPISKRDHLRIQDNLSPKNVQQRIIIDSSIFDLL